jgi:uncharacterized protein YbcI
MPSTSDATTASGQLAASISNGIVGLMHHYTGRGPVRARTTIDENLVVCVLGDTLTKAEQHMVDAGRRKAVLRGRRAMQHTISEEAIALVSKLTNREVVAFMSNNNIAPDLAVETFVLAPASPD